MRANLLWLKRIAGLGLVLMLGASMSACGFGSEKWKEEVQFSDGKIIVVEREMVRKGGGDEWASNRSGSMPKEYRIRFSYDGSGKMIEWRTTKIDFQTWPEVPLVFDIESGQPVVFSLVAISSGCEVYSKYVYRNGVWIEEPLPEKFEQRPANLLIFDDKDMQQFINLETKRKKNSDSHTQGFRQIGPTLKVCG